eukprot:TRINITY_DN27491_c0_g1_i1.p1 TRINITY_DN27491_c0_g1~~TRINITY_DN27491_c0_g1_i1.p1  ORF type:complete len:285 (-),score=35.45 TRINITY_DN27491_c0_g1_i1:108-962(-)
MSTMRNNFINCTSRAILSWQKELSPFFLGPIPVYYKNIQSPCLENVWQYAKVYKQHVDSNGDPTEEYWKWAEDGWTQGNAKRFPMGIGARPEYSLWDGKKYPYIPARKAIYSPMYSAAVVKTPAFQILQSLYEKETVLYLWDYDGHDHHRYHRTYKTVIHDPSKPLGHSFVLAMTVEGQREWEEEGDEGDFSVNPSAAPHLVAVPYYESPCHVSFSFVGDISLIEDWNIAVPRFVKKIGGITWRWSDSCKTCFIVELTSSTAVDRWCWLTILSWDRWESLTGCP